MNDEFTDLENELRGLHPRPASEQLEHRIGTLLDRPAPLRATAAWWQKLGFNRPMAAFGWGLASPALTASLAVIVIHFAQVGRLPAPPPSHPTSRSDEMVTIDPASAVNRFAQSAPPESAHATNVVYQALDEGVVLDGGQEPVHRVRYRSADLVQWSNPSTGSRLEVTYPREDVRLVPVQAD